MTLAKIKNFACGVSTLHNYYLEHYQIEPQKQKALSNLDNLYSAGCVVSTADKALYKPKPIQKVCHIVGSGWSLYDSLHLAKSKDAFVVGINNSALADLRFDHYYIEFAGKAIGELSTQQAKLIHNIVHPQGAKIFFKNILKPHNDIETFLQLFDGVATIIPDIELRCNYPSGLADIGRWLLKGDECVLVQYKSTIFTAIGVALRSGFTEIVLHGVDFGGPYFFQLPTFSGDRSLLPPDSAGIYGNKMAERHATNTPQLGVEALLPIISNLLLELGVTLRAGSRLSPSSEILGFYG